MPKRLPHFITIQKSTPTKDNSGGRVDNWSTFTTAFAFLKPLQGREYFAAQQVQAETTHRVSLWYIPGVASDMRVLFNNRILDIKSVINVDERNIELHLMCVDKGETT